MSIAPMNINDLDTWFIKIFLLLILGAAISIGEWLMYRYLLPRVKRRESVWRSSFLIAFHYPCQWYVWFLIASFIASSMIVHFKTYVAFETHLIVIRQVGSLLFLLWLALRFLRHAERELVGRTKIRLGRMSDPTNIQAIAQLLRIVIILVALLMALQTVGIKLSAVLTVGSVAMAVFGFAAKDVLSNFLGGLIIYWDRPFSVGDWIRSPDRNIEGTVEYIGWRVTRIFTMDKRPLYVPNSILTSVALENPSRMTHRRLKLTVGVRYSDAERVAGIVQSIDTMLRNHPRLDSNERVSVDRKSVV